MKIQVEAYSGHKSNQRPIKSWIGERLFFVESIEDQWYGVDAVYFRIRADDRNTHVLELHRNYRHLDIGKIIGNAPDRAQSMSNLSFGTLDHCSRVERRIW